MKTKLYIIIGLILIVLFNQQCFSTELPSDVKYEYIIITKQEFANTFKELAHWKTRKGIPAKVETVENIYSNPLYDGADKQEQIRNYIKENSKKLRSRY